MEFRISDTFTTSLAKLNGDEQKAVKMTAFDLQMDPSNPGMQFHKLDRAKDKNFWSVRVNRDIRLIVHKTEASLLLCYVDHHDAAYNWAERRKIVTHPTTGAAQLVEIRETVQEIAIPKYVEVEARPKRQRKLFESITAETLLGYGVPEEWLDDVHQADEDTLFEIADRLPAEAAEALLCLATGDTPKQPEPIAAEAGPFEHPDAQRRFRLMSDTEELAQALDYPWEKWTVFLHPSQREIVEKTYNGPARVAGSAGTGKTVVALHRAAHVAKHNPTARILVTTLNDTLANSLTEKLRHLSGHAPNVLERIEVHAISKVGERLYKSRIGNLQLADDRIIRELLTAAKGEENSAFSDYFVWSEWRDVVDAWQLENWEAYRDVPRLGRKTRLRESQRQQLWSIFEQTKGELQKKQLLTRAGMLAEITATLRGEKRVPYDFIVVDEAQDISVPELRFLAALGFDRPDSLFFAGDLGQRIFQPPFSWKSLGVDVRGRSRTLRINYRTSHQIRIQADKLLPPKLADVDGNQEDRKGTVSAFNGPEPLVQTFDSVEKEAAAVGDWLKLQVASGVRPEDIGMFVRTGNEVIRADQAAKNAGLSVNGSDGSPRVIGKVSVMTMHLAKGLEFRTVAVMACDDEILPLQERIESVADDADLEEVYNTERHLLYVACTRARDALMVSGVKPASEFLDDLTID
jgi:superfamily I DNA/RNA helicase/mRNA-degrading endonuclease RelE of RelBE toxin-antitoxin system